MIDLFPAQIRFSGSDYFQLLLDYHMRKNGQNGNVVRLRLDFSSLLNPELLERKISENDVLQYVNSLRLSQRLFAIPAWKKGKNNLVTITRHQNLSDQEVQRVILNRDLKINADKLIHFDWVAKDNGSTSLILSAHHALVDQRGMLNLMGTAGGKTAELMPKVKRITATQQFVDAMTSSLLLLKSSPKPLARLNFFDVKDTSLQAKYCVVRFSNEETHLIDKNCFESGGKLAKSPFYLAVTTLAVNEIIQKRKSGKFIYWIPVPQDQRLRGGVGSLLSNQLSFLFFKIASENLKDIRQVTSVFNQQMKEQIKTSFPTKYANLMRFFRRMPLSIYLRMVNMPTKGAMSSFTFSDLGEAGGRMHHFLQQEIKEILNYPPVPNPPGLTVVFMRFKGALKIIVGYVDAALSEREVSQLEISIKEMLLSTQ